MSTSPIVNPLGYQGVHSPNPPTLWFRPRNPNTTTFTDYRNYDIGDWWQNTITKQWWILISLADHQGIWVALTSSAGTGPIISLTGNDSVAVYPTLSGNINVVGDGTVITTTGTNNTETIAITGIVPIAHGGTGESSFVAFAPIAGGTTSTGALQSASTGIATSGFVFTSNGASALPSFQAPTGAVASISATAPLTANGVSGTPETGAVTVALTTPLTVQYGGTNRASLTTHSVLVGAGTSAVSQVGPNSTSGLPLISQGSSTDPTFGVAIGAGGGTGIANTGLTINLGSATTGYVLTSDSSGNATWKPPAGGGGGITTFRSGFVTISTGGTAITFSTPFPTTCLGVQITLNETTAPYGAGVASLTANGFTAYGATATSDNCYYLAYGN